MFRSNGSFSFCDLIVQQLYLLKSVRKPHLVLWIHSHWFLQSFVRFLSEIAKMLELTENKKALRRPWIAGNKAVSVDPY